MLWLRVKIKTTWEYLLDTHVDVCLQSLSAISPAHGDWSEERHKRH